MSATDLLSRLRALDVELMASGDRLRFRAAEPVPPELVESMRAHKAELLELLRTDSGQGVAESLPGGLDREEVEVTAATVASMPLGEFAGAALIVEVYSRALAERLVFASDNATIDPGESRVVYRAAELRELLGVDVETLRTVHEVKKLFGGTLEAS